MSSAKLLHAFKGKRVLVAGASGLTGRNLYAYMETLGADVTGTCLTNQVMHQSGMSMMEPMPRFYSVDFTDRAQTERFFHNYEFDYVFICCAQSYNAAVCRDNPERLIQPNLVMVSNLLEQCHKHKVERVLFMSSATVYQPHEEPLGEFDLNMNKQPHKLYRGIGWVKRYLETLCGFYAMQGLHVSIVRPTNIYGEFDKTDLEHCHVVPAFIIRALEHENPFVVHTLGDGIKNFIYVDDLVRDMSKIIAFGKQPDVYNLTSNQYASISEVCSMVIAAVKELDEDYAPHVRFEGYPDAVSFVGLDRSKFDAEFGEESYTTLTQGLRKVVKWYSSLLQTQKR